MAGLKRPDKCNQCESADLNREYHPERWVCSAGHIVMSRGQKPQTGICTRCAAKKSDGIKFKEGKNLCMDCYNTYMRDWNNATLEERKAYKKKYYAENREYLRKRSNAYWQSTPELFIADIFSHLKRSNKVRFNKKRLLVCTVTKEFLIDLYKKQNGKCAISGLSMVHKWGSLYSISPDRIDSAGGYTPDNVQFVCKGINMMKNSSTQAEAIEFVEQLKLSCK